MLDQKIKKVVEDGLSQGLENEANFIKDELDRIILNIEGELNYLERIEILKWTKDKQKERAQRLLSKIEEEAVATYENYLSKLEDIDTNAVIRSIVKLYFLTEEFFATIGVIRKPRFLMTYINEGEYIRYDFEAELLDENTKFNELFYINKESGTSGFGLRFNASTVAEKMKKIAENNEKEKQNAKALYKHYKKFITPYRRHENNPNTKWKMNEGVAREAFERHLENLHSQFINNKNELFKECSSMESVGRRWVMYRYASGSDPYFTGPDTIYSQVKAENASLISNIETILNTAKFIVSNSKSQKTSVEEMKKLLKTKGENEIKTFSKELYLSLNEKVQKTIVTEMAKDLGLSNYKVNDKNKDHITISKIRTKKT